MKNISVALLREALDSLPEINNYFFNSYLIEINLEKLSPIVEYKPTEPISTAVLIFRKSIDKKEWELADIK